MERFVIIANGWKPLIIITKRSILDVAAVLDPPLVIFAKRPILDNLQDSEYAFGKKIIMNPYEYNLSNELKMKKNIIANNKWTQ